MRILGFNISRAKSAGALSAVRSSQPWLGLIREPFSGAWQRNMELDTRDVLIANSAVFSSISIIATDIAKLRVKLMSQDERGIWGEVRNSPFLPVLRKPNRYQTRYQFFEAWISSKLFTGATYVLKQRDGRGVVEALYILDSHRVTPLVAPDSSVYYQLAADDLAGIGTNVVVPASEIIHDRGICLFHPLIGVSPIFACAASATMSNRIKANSERFFANMSRPSGVLTGPDEISDETANRLKEYWTTNFTGASSGKVAVLGDGLKFEQMAITSADAQLIEQLRWTVEDVARCFGIPLHMLNAGPMPTSNNVESLGQQYYSRTLQGLLESAELCLDHGLGLPNNYGTEFDLRGLLRMDTLGRYDALSKAVGAGWMAPNEARASEDLPPVAGGDTPYLQQQNWSLASLASRDSAELSSSEVKRARDVDELNRRDLQFVTKMLAGKHPGSPD